jgi:hypothetical protein
MADRKTKDGELLGIKRSPNYLVVVSPWTYNPAKGRCDIA